MQEYTEAILPKRVATEIDAVITAMGNLTITSDEELQVAGDWLRKNKATQKIVRHHFEPERKRTYEAYQAVISETKRYTDHLAKAESVVKRKVAAYNAEIEKRRRAALEAERRRLEDERLKQAEESGDESVLDEEIVVEKQAPKAKVDGVAFSENWQYEIVDEGAIPREFLVPDEKKIRRAVKATKGSTKIPGVRVYDAGTVRVRA